MTLLEVLPGLALTAGVTWPSLQRAIRVHRGRATLARSRTVRIAG